MTTIEPTHVHEILKKHQLTDGMDLVLDLDHSTGPWVHAVSYTHLTLPTIAGV